MKTKFSRILRFFSKLISGNAHKFVHGIYLMLILVFYLIINLYAQLYFPINYSIFINHISNQGGISANPDGYLIWNIGTIIIGILLIPHLLYIQNNIEIINYNPLKFNLIFITRVISVVAGIGISFVGIFPEDKGFLHVISAVIGLIGLFILFNLDLVFLLKWETPKKKKWCLLTIYFPMNFSFFAMFLIPNIPIILNFPINLLNSNLPLWFFNFPPWEWFFFLSLFFWMIFIYFYLPKRK